MTLELSETSNSVLGLIKTHKCISVDEMKYRNPVLRSKNLTDNIKELLNKQLIITVGSYPSRFSVKPEKKKKRKNKTDDDEDEY